MNFPVAPPRATATGGAESEYGEQEKELRDVDESLSPTEARRLQEEVAQLRQAMKTRPVIDQARGVLMAYWRCSPETAWRILVDISQHTNTKVREISVLLTQATHGRPMPDWLRKAARASYARVLSAARENGLTEG
ncbi:ANTAR domain-containing protein [Streptomyces spirodelae]|uniref:ANTAR domain-containing protein n=1 Tax=Streptomyces spirodelae TaxID=2812904 RepID=A0ABS3WU18_9ACTN|nr:ANTAR domain-containing protein [Streptomyces spirodelae]MBO8186322.1 ANTAR domain-containing protein [Streptomyces spirodelae]